MTDVERAVRRVATAWLDQRISAQDALRLIAEATLGGAAVAKTISPRAHEAAAQQRKRTEMLAEFERHIAGGRDRAATMLVGRKFGRDPQEAEGIAHWLRSQRRRQKNGAAPFRVEKSA